MTTLTRAKQATRLILLLLAACIVGIIVIRIVINVVGQINRPSGNNVARLNANVAYGKLDSISLPDIGVSAAAVNLSLDLVEGSLPQSSPTARVYKVASPSLSLSAQDRARSKATNLGFTVEPTQPDTQTFLWQQSGRTLNLNLRDQTFDLLTNLQSVSMVGRQAFTTNSLIGRQTAQFLQSQLLFTDINYSSPVVRFVNPLSDTFVPQPENATIPTSYAQVTFHRSTLNQLPFYTSKGKLGPITAIVVPARTGGSGANQTRINQDQLVNLHNSYLPIDKSQAATYPIINAATAFDLLKSNVTQALTSVEAVNSSVKPTTLNAARVLFVTLAYLEPDSNNPTYVQPVWLFEGRGSTNVGEAQWTAMVPAVDAQLTDQLLK